MSVLVRANVSIGGLAAGEVGEIPDGLYESARKRGYVEAVDRLESRLRPSVDFSSFNLSTVDPASFVHVNSDETDGIDHELPAPPPLP